MIRILVVDDLEALLDVVKYILESNPDFSVDTATSVAQALDFLEDHEYDIIISDYYMPEVNGLEFLKQVRSRNLAIPFVIQTGHGDEITALEALQSGADFFLEKGSEGPLQYLAFTQIINLLVSRHRLETKFHLMAHALQEICDVSRDGLLFIDAEGTIQNVNASFLEITGCQEDTVKEVPVLDLIPDEWKDGSSLSLKRLHESNAASEEFRREFIRCTGDRILVSIRARIVHDEFGKPEGMWLIISDLSVSNDACV